MPTKYVPIAIAKAKGESNEQNTYSKRIQKTNN